MSRHAAWRDPNPLPPCLVLVCPSSSAPYNCIWEFGYTIAGTQCDMLFTSVAGHLMELDFPAHYKRWRGCSPLDLYSAPVNKSVPQVRAWGVCAHVRACVCEWLMVVLASAECGCCWVLDTGVGVVGCLPQG